MPQPMAQAVPKQLNYADVLPVAIESCSNKRTFEPTNGTKFSPASTNVIRLNLNSDNLADFTHSYMQATLTNTCTQGANAHLALDTGVPWIQKIQIMSGGQELETIDAYNRLHSMLQSVQGNPEQAGEFSITQKEHFPGAVTPAAVQAIARQTTANPDGLGAVGADPAATNAAIVAPGAAANAAIGEPADLAATRVAINTLAGSVNAIRTGVKTRVDALAGEVNLIRAELLARDLKVRTGFSAHTTETDVARDDLVANDNTIAAQKDFFHHNSNAVATNYVASGTGQFTYNFTLISAILNQPKYFPLIFTNLGLDILIYLEDGANIGSWAANLDGDTGGYEITNVRYHCHLVDVDKSFYDRMRQSMMSSGGVLQFSGTTYKHYLDSAANNVSPHQLQISTRVRSLNALYVRPQRQSVNNQRSVFCISQGESCGMKSYQYRIGSVTYPQQPIAVKTDNMGESYNELRKCIGVLGNYSHNSWINESTFKTGPFQVDDNNDHVATMMAGGQGAAGVVGTTAGSGDVKNLFVAAYGFSGFAKTAAESGINVQDRALVCTCVVERDAILTDAVGDITKMPSEIRYDMFAETDILIYLTADGQVSTRI